MKKIYNYMLLGAMVLSITACGSGNKLDATTQDTGVAQAGADQQAGTDGQQGVDTNGSQGTTIIGQPQSQQTDANEQSSNPASKKFPQVVKQKNYSGEYDDASHSLLLDSNYDTLVLTDESADAYPALNKALMNDNLNFTKTFLAEHAEMLSAVKEDRQLRGDNTMSYVQKLGAYVKRADDQVLSFLTEEEYYSGGAHGDMIFQAETYDVQTGAKLSVKDVLRDPSGLADVLARKLTETYEEGMFENLSEILSQYTDDSWIWTLDGDGMTFYFNHYEIGPYAAGRFQARLSMKEDAELFTEAYGKPAETLVEELPMYGSMWVDLDDDGNLDELTVSRGYSEYEAEGSLDIEVNGRTCSEEIYAYNVNLILVRQHDGGSVLLAECQSDNDYTNIYSFTLDKNGAKSTGEPFDGGLFYYYNQQAGIGGKVYLNNPEYFELITRFDILSTYSAGRYYCIGSDGRMEPLEAYYVIGDEVQTVLTTKAELTTDLIDEKTHEPVTSGEPTVTLPIGSRLRLASTDGKSYIDLRMEDGRICRIYLDSTEYPCIIGGVEADQIFDGMMFAG